MLSALAFLVTTAFAGTPWECTAKNTISHTVIDTDGYQTLYDLQVTGWDPTPLLETEIDVGADGCLNAWFSVHNLSGTTPKGIAVGDDYGVFQVTIDGNPLWGHMSGCVNQNGTNEHCVIYSHEVDGATTVDGHSYHFFYPVAAGTHKIKVYYAGYDVTGSTPRGAYVGGSILTLQHE